jgi:hypothetical protein
MLHGVPATKRIVFNLPAGPDHIVLYQKDIEAVCSSEVLSPDQFAANVRTKGAGERVEFAVKLPGQGTTKDEIVWLPIDAKFPVEDYQRLIEAQERADIEGVEIAGKHWRTVSRPVHEPSPKST